MLLVLRITDLAIIESLEIEFGPGLTVLSGETGAGKSILVDALTLVLGGRGSSELIRSGADSAQVEALFDMSVNEAAREFLKSAGLSEDDSEAGRELVIRRVVSRSGRSRVWINGKIETIGALFELGRLLLDIYGQHEYQTLLRQEHHRALLDSFGGLGPALETYRRAYDEWKRIAGELAALDMDESKRREREDLLRYRVREIESCNPRPGEDDELASEREILRHAGEIKSAAGTGADRIYESDACVLGVLGEVSDDLRRAAVHDPRLADMAGQVEQAAAILEDAARELASHADRIEDDPDRLQWVEDRRHEIKGLKRKYGDTIEQILAARDQAREELENIGRRDELLAGLEEKEREERQRAAELADGLTKARTRAGKDLARRVEQELAGMGMAKTRFETRLERLAGGSGLGPAGADQAAFFISPNPGEELKPLAKIASGGELSRIMLALRVLPVDEGDVSSLVFDEVDAGIGGAVAEAVGLRMRQLAHGHQVLCVTHLPQIAALAHHHFRIIKHQDQERTRVEAPVLDGEERVMELARMLGGAAITDTTRAHAREMLEMAADRDAPGPSGKRPKGKKTG